MSSRPAGDDLMLRRATRSLALRAAVLVAAAMLLLVGLSTLVVVRGQHAASDELLRTSVASADDVGDPPPGSWLVLVRGGQVSSSPGLPAVLGEPLTALRRSATLRLTLADLRTGEQGGTYRVATQLRPDALVQVVLDLRSERAGTRRLLRAMGLASLLALLLAAASGALLGRRAVRPLADALALQRTFVADASHELRTPLTLLSTRAQLLDQGLRQASLDEQLRRDSAGVLADVHRLSAVLDDLLVAADPARQTPVAVVPLADVVDDAVRSAQAHASAVQVRLTCAVHPAGRGETTEVLGAGAALRRAVLALVDNAIDHTPPAGSVTVTVRPGRQHVVLRVMDTGPGLDATSARDVLRRFHSGSQRAGRAHYGLGLALTHDIVNRHGGRLRLLDETEGATFEAVLPAAPSST